VSNEFHWIAVAAVTVLSAARLTRLATVDKFPPSVWVRDKYADFTDKTPRRIGWQLLLYCGYCFSFWATLLVVLAGWLSEWHEAWWVVNCIFGGSYLAAIVMAHDGDDGDEDEDD
jgi:hypothetical protein